MLGPYMCSVQGRVGAFDQLVPLISFSINEMKPLVTNVINKQTEALVRRNAFSVGVNATKLVKGVRMYQRYNTIVGVVHSKYFLFVDGMTRVDLHNHIEVMRPDFNKPDLSYEVNIAVVSIQCLQVGKPPYIVPYDNPQLNNESNELGSGVLCACDSASASLDGMRFLNSYLDGV